MVPERRQVRVDLVFISKYSRPLLDIPIIVHWGVGVMH